jgi:hypothetical protein
MNVTSGDLLLPQSGMSSDASDVSVIVRVKVLAFFGVSTGDDLCSSSLPAGLFIMMTAAI